MKKINKKNKKTHYVVQVVMQSIIETMKDVEAYSEEEAIKKAILIAEASLSKDKWIDSEVYWTQAYEYIPQCIKTEILDKWEIK